MIDVAAKPPTPAWLKTILRPSSRVAACSMIEPFRCNGRVLEGGIDGIENAVGADFHHSFSERLRAEVAARGNVEVLSQWPMGSLAFGLAPNVFCVFPRASLLHPCCRHYWQS